MSGSGGHGSVGANGAPAAGVGRQEEEEERGGEVVVEEEEVVDGAEMTAWLCRICANGDPAERGGGSAAAAASTVVSSSSSSAATV